MVPANPRYLLQMVEDKRFDNLTRTTVHTGRVGQNHIYGAYTVILAGKSPNTVVYGVHLQLWPTLCIGDHPQAGWSPIRHALWLIRGW